MTFIGKTTFLRHLSSLLLLAIKANNDSKKITLDNFAAQRQVLPSAIMHIRDISYQEDIQNEVRMVGCAERARLFRKLVPSDGGELQRTAMGCLFTHEQRSEELAIHPQGQNLPAVSPPQVSGSSKNHASLPGDTESLQSIHWSYLPWIKKTDLFLTFKLALSSSVYATTIHLVTVEYGLHEKLMQ